MYGYQFIFCIRKVTRAKFNKHNRAFQRYLKRNTVNAFVEELRKVDFSYYERFFCMDVADNGFTNKLMRVSTEIAPRKEIRM